MPPFFSHQPFSTFPILFPNKVFWDNLAAVPLPAELIKEYDGKIMAITGFEVDILRNISGKVEHVPCYESYNHHYGMSFSGKGATTTQKRGFDPEAPIRNSHGGPSWTHAPNGKDSGSGFYAQSMSEHNGNEVRAVRCV